MTSLATAYRTMRILLPIVPGVMAFALHHSARAQSFPFTSGPIPLCDTSTFTATVSGIGTLVNPDWDYGYYLDNVVLNITTDHPQTLQITLTSPEGTTLLLSAFNGAGGQNYTNTTFPYWGGANITSAAAPFTGSYSPQGGSLSAFNYENADGIWTITVIDTACAITNPAPGGGWTPGWFNGGVGGGGFSFGFANPPPPCTVEMGDQTITLCPGETVDILSGYEASYGGNGVQLTVTDWGGQPVDPYAVSGPGSFYVEGYEWWGDCYYFAFVDVFMAPEIVLGPDQTVEQCAGAAPVDLAALFDLSGAATVEWTLDGQPIAPSGASSATVPGVYTVSASNGGCSDEAQVTLSMNAQPVLGPDQAVALCPGTAVDLDALFVSTGLSVTWTFNGAPVNTPTAATEAGVYTISVVTADGCTDSADVNVAVEPSPALGPDQSADLCGNAVLDLTTLYATAGFSASWTHLGLPVPNPAAVDQAGTYQLVATSAAGCADTALVVVSVNEGPVLGADQYLAICPGETADLTTYYNTAGLSTDWTLAGVAVPDPAAVDAPGVYTIVVTDAMGCSATAQVELEASPLPVLGPDQQVTVCAGTTIDLDALVPSGGYATAWTFDGEAVNDPGAVVSPGSYVLTATTSAGCSASAEVTLQVDPSPTLGADLAAGTCSGTPFDLTGLYATAGLATAWTLGGSPVADPASVLTPGSYQLVVSNAFNCTDTATVVLTVNANPSLGGDQLFTLCSWGAVDLTTAFPVTGMDATFTMDGMPVADPTQVTQAGVYTISVMDAAGCSDTATATVVGVECLCEADFTVVAPCMQEPALFTLLADSAVVSAYWDLHGAAANSTERDPVVLFTRPGEWRVTLRAQLTCGEVTVERIVRIEDCADKCNVYIPSAFSPDEDGINDLWAWNGECLPEAFTVDVFDRWGQLVFTSTDPLSGWDGTMAGKDLPTGVYAYRVAYRLPYQEPKEAVGSVTLLR